uniref:Uncharacterized protein n=1 Tax=Vespula pensylvanica TaxID=30213 RepID=A0A834P4W4_VESPE|nr:hypothetical protein H0235_005556 [Vespula pensylvanica]
MRKEDLRVRIERRMLDVQRAHHVEESLAEVRREKRNRDIIVREGEVEIRVKGGEGGGGGGGGGREGGGGGREGGGDGDGSGGRYYVYSERTNVRIDEIPNVPAASVSEYFTAISKRNLPGNVAILHFTCLCTYSFLAYDQFGNRKRDLDRLLVGLGHLGPPRRCRSPCQTNDLQEAIHGTI